jgi:hypothetical protein
MDHMVYNPGKTPSRSIALFGSFQFFKVGHSGSKANSNNKAIRSYSLSKKILTYFVERIKQGMFIGRDSKNTERRHDDVASGWPWSS